MIKNIKKMSSDEFDQLKSEYFKIAVESYRKRNNIPDDEITCGCDGRIIIMENGNIFLSRTDLPIPKKAVRIIEWD